MSGFLDIVKKRRSIRRYFPKAVPEEIIIKCIDAARFAPTACNKQRIKIIVARNELKNRLVDKVLGLPPVPNKWAKQAPVIAVFAVDRDLITHRLASWLRNIQYDLIDVGIAGEHFVLQAVELGLGTCWIGWFNSKKASKILGLPRRWRVAAMISLGFPAEQPPEINRRGIEESVIFNSARDDL